VWCVEAPMPIRDLEAFRILFCFVFCNTLSTFAPDSKGSHSSMAFSFSLTLFLLATLTPTNALLRVAFMSDLHVGEACEPIPYNGTENCACIENDKRAIAYLNTLDPDAVIITGDLTSSSWPSQWTKVKELISNISVKGEGEGIMVFPLLGNHDISPYTCEGCPGSLGNIGDTFFEQTFGPWLRASPNVSGYSPTTVHNPLWNCTSRFQNFQVNLIEPETGARLAFIAGDWSTREPAPPPNSGVPGWAERGLSDFPGGTLPWFRDNLAAQAASPTPPHKLFLIQHQPISCPFYIPDFLFCFGALDKVLLQQAMLEHFNHSSWWGVFAGHNHLFLNQSSPFGEGWPEFREVEFSATKGDGVDANEVSAVSMVALWAQRLC